MSLFSRKKKKRFKATLTYGEDILALYDEAKRLEREARVWRDRIYSSAEWEKKEELEKAQKEFEDRYEALLGKKHGFDTSEVGVFFHLRDYMKGYNQCNDSPFGYHGTVWKGDKREDVCIFCKKNV